MKTNPRFTRFVWIQVTKLKLYDTFDSQNQSLGFTFWPLKIGNNLHFTQKGKPGPLLVHDTKKKNILILDCTTVVYQLQSSSLITRKHLAYSTQLTSNHLFFIITFPLRARNNFSFFFNFLISFSVAILFYSSPSHPFSPMMKFFPLEKICVECHVWSQLYTASPPCGCNESERILWEL